MTHECGFCLVFSFSPSCCCLNLHWFPLGFLIPGVLTQHVPIFSSDWVPINLSFLLLSGLNYGLFKPVSESFALCLVLGPVSNPSNRRWAKRLCPWYQVWDPVGFPGPWSQPGPVPAVTAIWGVKKQVQDLISHLFYSLVLSFSVTLPCK